MPVRGKCKGYRSNGARNCQSGKQNIRDKRYNTPHARHAHSPQAVPDPAGRIAVALALSGRYGNRLHEPQCLPRRLLRNLQPNPIFPGVSPEDQISGCLPDPGQFEEVRHPVS